MAVVGGAGHLWGAVLGAARHHAAEAVAAGSGCPRCSGASGNFETIVFGLLMLVRAAAFRRRALARAGPRLAAAS